MSRVTVPLVGAVSIAAALFAGTSTLAAQAVSDDVNLFAAYGSIKNDDGLIGLVGEPFDGGDWTYSTADVGEVWSAGAVDCEDSWSSWQFLCDPAPTTNTRGELTQSRLNLGFTSAMDDQNSVGFVVIDLGEVSTFNSLEIYQMVDSDGNVTGVSMEVSSATGDTWPTEGDESWSQVVPTSDVVDETDFSGSAPYTNTDVTTFDFEDATGRYVVLYFLNDASYENDEYIEVGGAKLFGHRSPLAETGVDSNAVGFAGVTALVAAAVGFAMRRRARA
jgi:hypothetical protein